MFKRERPDLSKGAAPQSNPQLTLKEQLSIDRSIREDLGVSSLVVIEDSKLPDTCPWNVCRRASRDGEGVVTMSAEIRLSPALANQSINLESSCHEHLRQIRAIFSYVVTETGRRATEVSLDTTLPYSKPYHCVNRLDADDNVGFVTSVAIGSDFAKRIEQSKDPWESRALRNFESDLRVLSCHALVLRPSEKEGMFEVCCGRFDNLPYPIAEPVKRLIDVFMRSLQLFNPDARRYDPGPQSLLDPLLYNSTALHRLRNSSQLEESDVNLVERYEQQQRLAEQQISHEEALSSASEDTRRFFGDEILESLLFAVEELKGDVGEAIAYFRDFNTIHGYRYLQYQERLEYLFESHPLLQRVDAHNQASSDRQAAASGRDMQLTQPETMLFLQFRLSSTDINLPPHAAVVLSTPYEHVGHHNHNERLVCVTLTPTALKLLLNAKSPDDESIQPLMREIDLATERLFGGRRDLT
jgi:hypothetical protein